MKRWNMLMTVGTAVLVLACGPPAPMAPTPVATASPAGAPVGPVASGPMKTGPSPTVAPVPAVTTAPAVTPGATATATVVPTEASTPTAISGERIVVADLGSDLPDIRPDIAVDMDLFARARLSLTFGDVRLLDPATRSADESYEPLASASVVAASPDGRYVATASDEGGRIIVGDVTNGTSSTITTTSQVTVLGWRPDGRLTYSDGRSDLWLAGTSGGANERITAALDGRTDEIAGISIGTLACSPDGRWLAFDVWQPFGLQPDDNGLYLFDAQTKRTTTLDLDAELAATWPAWSPSGTELAFVGTPVGEQRSDIYVVGIADGAVSGRRRKVTTDPASEVSPVWSPDGTRIAYGLNARGTFDVFASAADGSGPQELLATDADAVPLAWATFGGPPPPPEPDPTPASTGTGQVLVTRTDADGAPSLALLGPDGALLSEVPLDGYAASARLSPDGTRVAFVRSAESGDELYVIGTDGTGQRRLTTGAGDMFAWSPDSQHIAFYQADTILSVISADGTGERALAEDVRADGFFWAPAWRPDGGAIAVAGSTDDESGLYLVTLADGQATRLPTGEGWPSNPAWVPDGRLVYRQETEVVDKLGAYRVYRLVEMDPSEAESRTVLEAAGEGASIPVVSPTGDHIAFADDFADEPLRVLDRATGTVVDVPGASLGPTEFAWSPDGRHFAYLASEDLTVMQDLKAVFVSPADASSRRCIADATDSISWSPRP
ncbi:hypothetical protein BH24ACT5_BH24ACT5_20630 [soil metagenome]